MFRLGHNTASTCSIVTNLGNNGVCLQPNQVLITASMVKTGSGQLDRCSLASAGARSGIRGAPRFRILNVIKHFRPEFTGGGIFLERLSLVIDALAPGIGQDMLVTCTPRPVSLFPAPSALHRVVYLSSKTMSDVAREFALLRWLACNLHKYRVVHFHTHADRYFLAYALAKLTGRRIFLSATLDDSVPELVRSYRPLLRPIVTRLFGLFDGFVALCPKHHAMNIAYLGGTAKTHLVPTGVHVPSEPRQHRIRTRDELGIAARDCVLIFVGAICDRKDPLFLVEQLPAILAQHPATRLLIVGPVLEDLHAKKIGAAIRKNSLERHVLLLGPVLDPDLLYAAADIMTFASHLEGFGAVVTEAMAHEVPPVVRRLPGVNDVFVEHGQTGFLFDTPEQYVQAVCRLISDVPLRQRLGCAGRQLVSEKFDSVATAKHYLKIYGVAVGTQNGWRQLSAP